VTNLLPQTPAPYADETLFPYMLRLSEANCYPDPRYLAYAAGVDRTHWNRPYPSYPASLLAPLVGYEEKVFERMGYRTILGNSLRFKLLDHDMGLRAANALRVERPAFCVQCVREEGYVRGFWDMAPAVVCPRHASLGVDQCLTCGRSLTWYRRGLLKCRCNADLGEVAGAPADRLLVDLMKVLEAKIERSDMPESEIASEFPLSLLEAMPLFDCIRLVEVLGDVGTRYSLKPGEDNVHRVEKVRCAASLLLEWPTRFHSWLESLDSLSGKPVLPKMISRIDTALFRGKKLSEGMRRLKETLNPFLARVRIAASVSNRRVAPARVWRRSQPRGLAHETFRTLSAGLGIHVQTLKLLRERGTYESVVELGKRQQWRRDEITKFGERLLSMAGAIAEATPGTKLKALLALKFRNSEVKVEAVEAVLSGKLPVVGLAGPRPVDLVLDTAVADQWVREMRLREGDGTYSFPEAAAAIGVDMTVIPDAIGLGLLATVQIGDLIRVTGASVEVFLATYQPVVQLAKQLETSATRLVRFIEGRGLQTLCLKRTSGRAEQAILLRKLQPEVSRLWLEEKKRLTDARPRQVCPEAERMSALMAYIDRMKKDGMPLPRRAGHLDKSAIAQACGFSRNEFYVRPELARLLEAACLEEKKRARYGSLDSVDVLRAYLLERRESGLDIPRKANGRPNKLVIAQDCGVPRNVFYKDEKAARMIEAVCRFPAGRE
jgi:hypothetical protein